MSFNYMQPFVTLAGGLQTQNAAGATEFNSMYESFNALTTVNKQHFVEWFSGDAIDSIWTKIGTGTAQMEDSVDGGFSFESPTGNVTGYYFNNKRQYAHNGSVFITVAQRINATSGMIVGLNDGSNWDNPRNEAGVQNDTSNTYYVAISSDSTTQSTTNTSVSVDTSWRVHKGELDGTDLKLTIDGTLEATKTTNMPTAKMQPQFLSYYVSGNGKGALRYYEAYNT